MYTNPNMSFLFTAEYCAGLMLSSYNITVINDIDNDSDNSDQNG